MFLEPLQQRNYLASKAEKTYSLTLYRKCCQPLLYEDDLSCCIGMGLELDQFEVKGKGKRVAIYTDSKYAFLVLYAHVAIWKERGHLTTQGSPIKYDDQILRL